MALIVVSVWTATAKPVLAIEPLMVIPTNVQAQEIEPQQMGPFLSKKTNEPKWGTREYYDTKNVWFSAKAVSRNLSLVIGGAPQVAGGLVNYTLADNEEWFILTEDTRMMTMANNRKLYIGWVKAGEKVLRNKKNHPTAPLMIKAIYRCGNWARAIGISIIVECSQEAGPCVDTSPLVIDEALSIPKTKQDDGSFREVIAKSNKCRTEFREIITYPAPPPIDNSCKVDPVSTLINKYGFKKPIDALAYSQANLTSADWVKYGDAITKMINGIGVMATEIIIVHDNCNVAVGLKLIQQGGIPKWVYGLMVGLFVLGIFVGRWTKSDTPPSIITGVKTQSPGTGTITRIGQNGGTVYE